VSDHDPWHLYSPITWIAHAGIALLTACVMSVLFRAFWHSQVGVVVGFDVGAVGAAAYFHVRELRDKAKHKNAGAYDESQFGAGVTSREDRIGDLLGPYTVAGTAVLLSLLLLVAGWVG